MDCWISSFRSIFGRAVRKSSDFRRYVLVFFIGWFVQIWSSWHAQIYAKKKMPRWRCRPFSRSLSCVHLKMLAWDKQKSFCYHFCGLQKSLNGSIDANCGEKKSWVFYDRAVLHAHKICPFGFWVVFVRAGQRLDLLKIQENRFLNSRVLLVGVAMWVDCAKM